MRIPTIAKIALLAAAVALPTVASAKTALPPGACAFGKKGVVAAGAMCSFNCDPKTNVCAQQACWNGHLTTIVSCFKPFCFSACP